MSISFNDQKKITDLNFSQSREVLLTGENGSYSMTSMIGMNTRKYHGILVTRQPQIDEEQHVLVNTLQEFIVSENENIPLGTQQFPGTINPEGYLNISSIQVGNSYRVNFKHQEIEIEKEIIHLKEGRVIIRYLLLEGNDCKLIIRPLLSFRNKHGLTRANDTANASGQVTEQSVYFRLYDQYDPVYFQADAPLRFNEEVTWYFQVEYQREQERGYEFAEDLLNPGTLEIEFKKGKPIHLAVGTKESVTANISNDFNNFIKSKEPLSGFDQILEHAAQQFIIRRENLARIIAGFPWFGRWGRDTFISLPGLTLSRNDPKLCKLVIDTIIEEMHGPLFPNLGTGDRTQTNSVDAPLWFFWAIQEYTDYTGSYKEVWDTYGQTMKNILEGFRDGTSYNIRMAENGMIEAGKEGKALTWMDAVCDGIVFTPRRGMAVEINALWYNAICFSLDLAKKCKDVQFEKDWAPISEIVKTTFIEKFWDAEKGYLADCIDGENYDWSIRPNQLFASSLEYTMLSRDMMVSILEVTGNHLLTKRGLRTLSPHDEKYIGTYFGNQYSRDAAYHQGTVWPWLLGHYCETYLRVYEQQGIDHVVGIINGFEETLYEHGIGSISEIYDGDEPHTPRGAPAQAWSVSEILRIKALIKSMNNN